MNLLQFESSPYLKQHKENPVEWRAWSKATLVEAKKINKPILVSIGYSTCHWCHVMAHESFEDPETAALMNAYFINIKIDREERPDLDHYFMNAIQAMGISGGWPLHCFLSPEGKPFFGGTYFPPEPKYGRPSWKQILQAIHQAFQNKPDEIIEQADQLFKHLNQLNKLDENRLTNNSEINLNTIYKSIESAMDKEHGGFGTHPKFPNTQGIQLLFHLYFLTGNKDAIQHALYSLHQMGLGGIYDHIDGGFCRYSVDAKWDVPHFEKMLYDHAQLIQTLAIGYQYNQSPFLKHIITQSLHFFENTMQDACGLFYAAIDADSDGEEGNYYVWTKQSLHEILEDDYESFFLLFDFSSLDHIHTDKKVLRLKKSLNEDDRLTESLLTLKPLLSKLKKDRDERTLPSIDRKMIVCWNAMMVSAYLSWYRASQDESQLAKAKKLMQDLINLTFRDKSELFRYYIDEKGREYGFLEDYAFLIKALLDLFQYTLQVSYMEQAIVLFEYVHVTFKNSNSSIYNISSSQISDFEVQQLDWAETTYPNPNAILSWACRYFYEFTEDKKYLRISDSLLLALREQAISHPLSMASWVQQVLIAEWGPIVLKTGSDDFITKDLKDCHIPGLMRLLHKGDPEEWIFCFEGICHPTVRAIEEVLPLFSKYAIQLENQG